MSVPSPSNRQPDTAEPASFDDIADELYRRPPAEFTAARDEHVRQLRAAGDKATASAVAKLRKPIQSAWLLNLLWREHGHAIEELLGLAEPLRSAQERRSGDELRELSTKRRELTQRLTGLLGEVAERAGVKVTADITRAVGDTLDAALADPAVTEQLRTGRLTQPASYAGFGAVDSDSFNPFGATATPTTPATPTRTPAGKPRRRSKKAPDTDTDSDAARRAAEKSAAEKRVADAAAALNEANEQLSTRDEELRRATEHRDGIKDRIEQLRRELQEQKDQLSAAEKEVRQATRRHEQATNEQVRGRRRLESTQEEQKALS